MKRFLSLCCALALPLIAHTALAEPMVASGGYTAYLGENNYLFVVSPEDAVSMLRYPIADVLSVTDTYIYCQGQDGRLFGIRLDGGAPVVVSASPTAADLAAVTAPVPYTLENGTLRVKNVLGGTYTASSKALAATANEDRVFYIEQALGTETVLKAVDLNTASSAAPVLLGTGVAQPLSMTATADTLTMVAADHSVTVMNLIDNSQQHYPAASQTVERALSIGGTLLLYRPDPQRGWQVEGTDILPSLQLVDLINQQGKATATVTPTATPTPTPTPRVVITIAPTRTVKPTATPKASEYERLSYGDSGSAVRKMQKRLSALGYPVGTIDGVWGEDTQLAVNLFQCAIGYTEHSYATSAMQEKLYSRKAPMYDRYAPLREGDKGTDVKLMQKALFDLGFFPSNNEAEEVDGVYGRRTTEAVKAFQTAAGYDPRYITGNADADTLMLLFSANPPTPATPTVTPPLVELITPVPSPATPTPTPTVTPTPSPEPSEDPTPSPEPSEDPTPSPEPSEEPTPSPEPSEDPTPSPEPSEEPTPSPEPSEDPATPTPEPIVEPIAPEPDPEPATPTPEPIVEPIVPEPKPEPSEEVDPPTPTPLVELITP